jgi:hypothetical protein
MRSLKYIIATLVPVLAVTAIVYAGSLTPPGSPAAAFYTLSDIYNRLTTTNGDATTSPGLDSFTTPGSVAPTFHNLTDVYNAIPTIDATKVLSGTTYLGVAGSASAGSPYPSAVLKTGETLCYDIAGDPTDCAGTGEDGEHQSGQATSYTDNGNGTITDNATGLMWQKCSSGFSGTNCTTGSDSSMTFNQATSTCAAASTGGHSDWRLPNLKELLSLVDYGVVPSINSTYFPHEQTFDNGTWTSTADEGNSDQIRSFVVDLSESGSVTPKLRDGSFGTFPVLCVRSLP